jgi:diguanylate cyclase (GGDEF)-like protein
VAWHGFPDETAESVNWATINSARGTIYDAVHHQKISILNQIKKLQSRGLGKDAVKRGARSTVCLPVVADNITLALLVLYVNEEDFFDEEEVGLLNEISADIAFALEAISKQKKLDYLAYFDELTGLANSALFNERVEQRIPAAKRDGKSFEVVLLDVDRFRNINETIGRQAGDDLIRQIGQRFQNTVRDTDILAHVTADRFAIATRNLEMDSAAHALERILAAVFGASFQVGGSELRITARAGIAVYPEDGGNVEVLLRNAEAALAKAKQTGQAYAFYQPAMNAKVAHNLLLENKLRQALDKGQFVLHYQPKINLATGRIAGLEALIRWQDPDSGLVPPIQFIPLLEETGMILEVGHWAMFQALYDFGKWLSRGLNPPRIAVNVSPIQLRQKNFSDVVHDALMRHPESSRGLDLEITESLIMEDIEGNIDRLRAVRNMGVKIAIDDFGTGYSSLSYLARLPVDALKIDRSFIITMAQSAENMAIVSTIISLAHALKLKVIAEGVDAEDQKSTLVTLGCDELQGYLFSRPVAAADLEARWLKPAAGL